MLDSTRCIRARALGAVALLAITATTAHAQDAQATDAPQASGNLGSDIIVTAQRRPERLQDVPVAVTAFSEEMIRNLNLNDAIKTAQMVPGMIATHNAGLGTANAYYLRGLGNSQSVATFDPPVGTYVDNVYVARQNANNYQFFDVDRVEVLRGPQGTLFGRNTTGGAVSVIMKKPSDRMGAKFEATYGSYDRVTAKTTVDLPVSERVLTKWSAYYVYDKGYLKNVTTGDRLNGERNYGFRGDVRFLPTDDLTIDLSGEYTRNTGTYLGVYAAPGASDRYKTTTTPDFYNTRNALPEGNCKGDPVNILLTTVTGNCSLTDSYATTADVNWNTDAGNLELIAGYREQEQGYINNYNGTTTNVYAAYILADKIRNHQVSTELKWTGEAFDDKLKYVACVLPARSEPSRFGRLPGFGDGYRVQSPAGSPFPPAGGDCRRLPPG
ncbi:TonB-dependent receptor [Novosphingobium resinovorum]